MCTKRSSVNPFNPGPQVQNEDLLVSDEQGNIFFYAVEWPPCQETFRDNWRGSVQCLAYITVHTQQICGLSWSPDGDLFATGGNDNLCFLFEPKKVEFAATDSSTNEESGEARRTMLSAFREPVPPPSFNARRFSGDSTRMTGFLGHTTQRSSTPPIDISSSERRVSASSANSNGHSATIGHIDDRLSRVSAASLFARFFQPGSNTRLWDLNRIMNERAQARYPPSLPATVPVASEGFRHPISNTSGNPRTIDERHAKHRWEHTAAVKAIAFCPWRKGLVATGGGSHDKCIHFYHTTSGVALATIAVHAQVTSLIWSTTRREIAATFGYAQPDHPYRIAVFSWPECRQVAAIP